MKRIFFFIILFFVFGNILKAQYISGNTFDVDSTKKTEQTNKNKVFYGGNLGLQFGTITLIEVSPLIGYKLTENLHVGVGAIYKFINYTSYNYKENNYGGNVFARCILYRNVFAYTELEELNLVDYTLVSLPRMWLSSWFVGGGFRRELGERAALNWMILYNLNESIHSPYQGLIYKMSIEF